MMADSDLEDKYSKYNFDDEEEEDLEDKYSKFNFDDDDEEDLEDKYSKFNFDDDEEEEEDGYAESKSKTYKRPTPEQLEASRNRIIEGTGFDMRFRKKKKRRVKKSRKKV